jgi:hypothetical protein
MLHSAQNDSAVSTFFRFKTGSDGRSTVIFGRDLTTVAVSATSAVGAFVITTIPVAINPTAMCASGIRMEVSSASGGSRS